MSTYLDHKHTKPVLRERGNDLFTIRFDPGEPFSGITLEETRVLREKKGDWNADPSS